MGNPFCFVCKNFIESYSDCTLEHIFPRSLGGTDDVHNLSISHAMCNSLKGSSTDPKEWAKRLQENIERQLRKHSGRKTHFVNIANFSLSKAKISLTDQELLIVLKRSFREYNFVQVLVEKIPKFLHGTPHTHSMAIVAESILELCDLKFEEHKKNIPILGESSCSNRWRIIYAIILMVNYSREKDPRAINEALYLIELFVRSMRSPVYYVFCSDLREICLYLLR